MGIINDVCNSNVKDHELKFWWLGQQSWVVKTSKHTLFFDPYLTPRDSRNTPPFFTPEEMTGADFIFGTHDHIDHIDRPSLGAMMQASPNATLFVPRMAGLTLPDDNVPSERMVMLDDEISYEKDGMKVTAIKAKHEFFDYSRQTGYPFLQYIVESGGMTIYHAGDTLLYDGMLKKLNKFNIDLALVPINGRDAARYSRNCLGNMTWQEAVDLCGELRPALSCPAHYEMFNGNTEDPDKFRDYLEVKYPDLKCWIGMPGESMVLDKNSRPERTLSRI